jgi:hypothetical protein
MACKPGPVITAKYILHLPASVFIGGTKFMAKEVQLKLKEGDPAPAFTAQTEADPIL